MPKRNNIDRGLDKLLRETPHGVPLLQIDIAKRCGCTEEYIYLLEKRALKKLRNYCLHTRKQEFSEFLEAIPC